jgi:hypothetical protein
MQQQVSLLIKSNLSVNHGDDKRWLRCCAEVRRVDFLSEPALASVELCETPGEL